MILSTHAIVGGAIASHLPTHPIIAIALCFASHFIIDAIPHWDYPLRSISVAPGHGRQLKLSSPLLFDAAVIGFDAAVGLLLAIILFATPATIMTVILGVVAAMLPDPLQFIYSLYPREPLVSLQRFHRWVHTKHKLTWPLGITSQIIFAAAVAAMSLA